jgi:threonine/homoserine/homoserine lactone efflux protein
MLQWLGSAWRALGGTEKVIVAAVLVVVGLSVARCSSAHDFTQAECVGAANLAYLVAQGRDAGQKADDIKGELNEAFAKHQPRSLLRDEEDLAFFLALVDGVFASKGSPLQLGQKTYDGCVAAGGKHKST